MNINPQKKSSEQMVEAIFALDLEPIKTKLMDKTEGQGWTRAQADHYELEYKRFLALLARFPNETIAPNKEVDKFWHGHILDTMKYAEDCDKVFGFFLHHYPYFGMRGDEDAANLAKAFVNMQRLHQQEFGSGVASTEKQLAAWCGAASATERQAAWCGAAVKAESPAWCGAAVKTEGAAWCGAVAVPNNTGAEKQPAWCGASAGKKTESVEGQVAWCGAAVAPRAAGEQEAAAWCGAAIDPSAKAAWCGAVASPHVETVEQKAAWCGAVQARI